MKLRIEEKRRAAKLSQTQLADRLSVTPQVINNWERGIAYPRTTSLPDVARVLQCSIDDLFDKEVEAS